MTPETAVKLMRIVGTVEAKSGKLVNELYLTPNAHGFPTFGAHEILESGQIKASFGQSHKKLLAQLRDLRVSKGLEPPDLVRLLPDGGAAAAIVNLVAEKIKKPKKVSKKAQALLDAQAVIDGQEQEQEEQDYEELQEFQDEETKRFGILYQQHGGRDCTCEGTRGGRMIQCETCDVWFHFACVELDEDLVVTEEMTWHCPDCK
jgi:hypothetical protein